MIGIIDYGAGNIQSVVSALKKLGQAFEVIDDPAELGRCRKIIFPGVGAAGSAMRTLRDAGFMEVVPKLKVPFLGICLGMQLLADFSEEDGVQCLSIIPGQVRRLSNELKVPQVGWNKVNFISNSLLTKNIPDGSYFYFVHSYYFDAPEQFVVGRTAYGANFPSVIQKDNFYATQFHPEKSGEIGLQLLRNFCEKC